VETNIVFYSYNRFRQDVHQLV